jgi:hypothetical protein
MASRPDEPGRTGIGPEESDTPPDDLPDIPNIPGDGGVLDPDDDGDLPPGGPEDEDVGTETADISGPVPGDD